MMKYIKISIDKIIPDSVLDFNLFLHLPLNNKYIMFVRRKQKASSHRLQRCRSHDIKHLVLHLSELFALESYCKEHDVEMDDEIIITALDEKNGEKKIASFNLKNIDDPIIRSLALRSKEEREELKSIFKELQSFSEDEREAFYNEEAKMYHAIFDNENLSHDEKEILVRDKARDLVEEIFTEHSKKFTSANDKSTMIVHSKSIVAALVQQTENIDSAFSSIMKLKGSESDIYDHSTYVCTFAVMFAMGLGYHDKGLIAELALGALLHDLGLNNINPELVGRSKDLKKEEQVEYAMHPQFGIELAKSLNKDLSPIVENIIMHHHENFDGTGYPNKLKGNKIAEYISLVSIADTFDDYTTKTENSAALEPLEALELMRKENDDSKSPTRWDPQTLLQVINYMNLEERTREI